MDTDLRTRVRRWCIADARALVHKGRVDDALLAFARGERSDLQDALDEAGPPPEPVTDADLAEFRAQQAEQVHHIRAYVAKHGAKWAPHVRERWLALADLYADGGVTDLAVKRWGEAGKP